MSTLRLGVLTGDEFLYRKIELDAPQGTEVVWGAENADIILLDKDTAKAPEAEHITMSRYTDANIKIPFRLGTVKNIILAKSERSAELTLDKVSRCAYLHRKKIKLTELEFSLLSVLYEKGGEFASRAEILLSLWGKSVDAGILNVYIHYLREKLEAEGEKIIISSRKCGYKLDGKYLGGNL